MRKLLVFLPLRGTAKLMGYDLKIHSSHSFLWTYDASTELVAEDFMQYELKL